NVVPDLVELEGEARSHNDNKLNLQLEHMQNIIKDAVEKYNGEVEFDIEELYTRFELPKESDIIKIVISVLEKMKIKPKFTVCGGGSDANIFNKKGLITANLGIGMEKVHSREERVKIENLVKLAELTVNVISELGS
ncbi:MAG: M20/M25/M40 family metallo-hydrolase, partial [Halanaerobiales bacterium]